MRKLIVRLGAFALTSFVAVFLTSCKTAYYPKGYNSPMLNNKNEIQISGVLGIGNMELQTAYAATDNIGVMLNASTFRETREVDEQIFDERRNLIEAGVGYYGKFGTMGKFEIFGGGGLGLIPADFRNVSYTYDGTQIATMTNFFIQPAIGLGSEVVDFSGVSRFSIVTINNEANVFFEPGLTIKLGYKSVRFVGGLGVSVPFKETNALTWDHNPFIMSLGVMVNLNRLYE
ncbi:MAG: hypothetical protein ACLFNU_00585 [Bacteroidales bacterium]